MTRRARCKTGLRHASLAQPGPAKVVGSGSAQVFTLPTESSGGALDRTGD